MFRSGSRFAGLLRRLIFLVLVGLVTSAGSFVFAAAQEATPEMGEEGFEGVSFEFLGLGQAAELPATPADVVLVRVGLEPGASLPADPEDPSVALVVVESGVLTLRMDTPMTVLHPAADGEPGPEDFEMIPAGEEFTLEAGDSTLFPPNVGGDVRNDGDEEVSALAAIIAPAEGGEGGTPVAGTPEG